MQVVGIVYVAAKSDQARSTRIVWLLLVGAVVEAVRDKRVVRFVVEVGVTEIGITLRCKESCNLIEKIQAMHFV